MRFKLNMFHRARSTVSDTLFGDLFIKLFKYVIIVFIYNYRSQLFLYYKLNVNIRSVSVVIIPPVEHCIMHRWYIHCIVHATPPFIVIVFRRTKIHSNVVIRVPCFRATI